MTEHDAIEDLFEALLDDDAEALYERAPCGYLSTTPDGTIIKVNGTFLRWTGYRREELVGRRSFVELLSVGGRLYHESHYAPMLRLQGKVREIALDIVRADGERIPALVNSVLERSEDGSPQVIRTAVFDATERRRYEEELLAARQRAIESEARATILARTLQQSLVPPAPPRVDGLDVAAAYRPAGSGDEIGGDFYEVFQLGREEWGVVIGDVRGKGVEAGVVAGEARHTVRAAAVVDDEPCRVLATLNEVLQRSGSDRFVTAAFLRLRYRGSGWTAATCTAGHPLPYLRRAGHAPLTVGTPGALLGVFDEPVLEDHQIDLHPGDVVVLYTDGITEARRGNEWYGEERLAAMIAGASGSAAEIAETLLADVLTFQRQDPRDDIVLVVLRVPYE